MSFTALVMLYNSTDENDFYRQLSLQVLKNIRAVPSSSSYQMADMCYVSPSAIRKLSKKLGYDSYSDFRASINWQLLHYLDLNRHYPGGQSPSGIPTGTLETACGALEQVLGRVRSSITEDMLDSAMKIIMAKPKISFFTTKASPQQNILQQDLILLGKEVTVFTALQNFDGLEWVDPDTAAILIKMDMTEPADMRKILQLSKERGASTIIISNSESIREKELCDISLCFRGAVCTMDMYGLDLIQQLLSMKLREYIN